MKGKMAYKHIDNILRKDDYIDSKEVESRTVCDSIQTSMFLLMRTTSLRSNHPLCLYICLDIDSIYRTHPFLIYIVFIESPGRFCLELRYYMVFLGGSVFVTVVLPFRR